MSAPAMNVRPAPTRTMPFTLASATSSRIAAMMPSATLELSALTGGLSTVAMPMSLSRYQPLAYGTVPHAQ